jgi:3-hydroxyisobutyrate dehydrogenase-like beta-hydroxyacid dehydrogenase
MQYNAKKVILAGVSPGKIVIDCATWTPHRMVDIERQVAARGGKFLEAPVSGSKGPAEAGSLIFLCAGDKTVFEGAKRELDAMGKSSFYFGPVGKGTEMKLVVNMVMGATMAAFAEGLALSQALDLPCDRLLEVLATTSACEASL